MSLNSHLASWILLWIQDNAAPLAGVLLALLIVQSVRLAWLRSQGSRRIARHKRLGESGERRARALLKQQGFRIESEQAGGSYELAVDGKPQVIHLRADFLVTKKGQRYVAEVKSGIESVKVTGRATRRQLLEYLFAFEVDGILLVDMHAEELREISFPGA